MLRAARLVEAAILPSPSGGWSDFRADIPAFRGSRTIAGFIDDNARFPGQCPKCVGGALSWTCADVVEDHTALRAASFSIARWRPREGGAVMGAVRVEQVPQAFGRVWVLPRLRTVDDSDGIT